MIYRSLLRPALLASIVFFLVACGNDNPTVVPGPKQAKVKVGSKGQPIEDIPVVVEENSSPEYVYDPSGLRDPFEALVMIRKPILEEGKPLTPLQKFDLSQFRLNAVIVGKQTPMAMVVAPGGKAYVLKKGTKIGKNGGVVVGIGPGVVHIEEKFYDFTGALSTTDVELKFTQKAGDN